MRIVVHWPRYGPLHHNRMRAAYQVLSEHGHEAIALEVASDDAVYDWREDLREAPYRRVTLFPGQNYDELRPNTLHRAVWKALDQLDPSAILIHSYSTPDARAALSWCRRRRRAALCMAESKADDAGRTKWREAIKRVLVSQFDAAQASGTLSSEYHAALGIPPDRIFVGYSVVDNEYFAEQAATYRSDPVSAQHLPGLNESEPFFFASARFIPRKDLQTLISAYETYRDRTVDPWRLVLLGDGPLRPNVERWISEVSGVTLAGWQQIDTLPAYYALASAFIHTASIDPWGLVVNEALASGLPVLVSTGAGCHADLVREGINGYTFAPGDVRGLAHLLHRVAHVDDLQSLGVGAREVIDEYPLRRFGTSLLAAAQAGIGPAKAHRPSVRAEIVTTALRVLARTPRAFHSVES